MIVLARTSHSQVFLRYYLLAVAFGSNILCTASEAQPEPETGLILYPVELEAFLDLDHIEHNSSNSFSNQTDWEFGVNLTQQGYYLDPAISWFSVNIQPSWTVGTYETDSGKDDRDGEQFNYLFQLNIFRDTPHLFGVNLDAYQNSNSVTGNFGSKYDNVIESKSAELKWKNKAFPMSLSVKEETLQQDFFNNTSNQLSQRNELTNSIIVSGRSSELNLRVEHKKMDDRVIARNNDFEQDQAYINHNLEWGKGSNLFSRLDYFDRSGFNAYTRSSLNETARIQHTDNIDSQTNYQLSSTDQNIKSDEQVASFQLNHRLYRNLNSSAKIYNETEKSDVLDEKIQGIELQSRYNKTQFFDANVNAGLGFAYKETDRNTGSGLFDVVDESHVIPLSGSVTLNTRFIITSTVIVSNELGTLIYSAGLDYEINDLPGDLTEIQAIPGGQINTGDTILVSYQATALPTQEFSTSQWNYNLGFDLGWVRFSHADRASDDKLASGADAGFLNDTRLTITNLNFDWNINDIQINLGAERSFNRNSDFESTTFTYQQQLTWQATRFSRWNISLTESYIEPNLRNSDLISARLFVDWRVNSQLTVKPSLSYWLRKDKDHVTDKESNDEYTAAKIDMHWNYRKVRMDLSYQHNERNIENLLATAKTNTTEDRIMFTLTRRFF